MTKDNIIYYGSQFDLNLSRLGDVWASNRAASFDEVKEQVMGLYMPDIHQPYCCLILPKIKGIKYIDENLIAEGTKWLVVYAYYPDLLKSIHNEKNEKPYSATIDNYIKMIEGITGHDFLSHDFDFLSHDFDLKSLI